MKNRKHKSPFFIYSILIHIILLVCLWWYSPRNVSPPIDRPGFDADVVLLPRVTEPRPPEIIEIPFSERTDNSIEEKEEPLTPPKPSVDLQFTSLSIDEQTPISMRNAQGSRSAPHNNDSDIEGPTHSPRTSNIIQKPQTHDTAVKINRHQFTYISKNVTDIPHAETGTIHLTSGGTLSENSPNAGAPQIHYGGHRGDAFSATGMTNTRGGSSTSSGSKIGGIYIKMMGEIANQLTAATTAKKVDIVFLVDETASMMDNIRGIRAYFDLVFDAFKREKRDAAYGLVTFTDKVKTYELTDDFGKFKNRLFKIDVDRGGDISEAGLDALMEAVTKMNFRDNAQRFFVLASDAAFHDADFNGRSQYSLDEVISTLQKEQIRVEVIGLEYLPIKQIAMGTGGTWRAIPGKGYLEYIPPITLTEKMVSKLGTLTYDKDTLDDKITVYVNNPPRPKQVTLTWKVLNPLGEKCYGPFSETKSIPDDSSKYIEFIPVLDSNAFYNTHGIYTVIYRLENDQGHKSILRRMLSYKE